jgi:hypothetical protein
MVISTEGTMRKQSNPFIVALTVIGICAGLLALILAAVANDAESYVLTPAVPLAASVWAGLFAQVAILATLGALVSAAVRWIPSEVSAVAPASQVDTSELTDGERKFFTGDGGR